MFRKSKEYFKQNAFQSSTSTNERALTFNEMKRVSARHFPVVVSKMVDGEQRDPKKLQVGGHITIGGMQAVIRKRNPSPSGTANDIALFLYILPEHRHNRPLLARAKDTILDLHFQHKHSDGHLYLGWAEESTFG
mmetsp:Transcript_21606/g.56106  ORF Transcript_21606/g.56106 Transcript_21606/m.56106 type:complete len:135 (+) Transcript_21606:399-803(+)